MRNSYVQPGFAMLLVLIIVAAGFILSVAYLSVASVQVQVSRNYQSLARARYIAESGLEHALYILRFSPEDLEDSDVSPLGPFYVDGSSDSYTIIAQEDSETPGLYRLTTKAVTAYAKRTSSVTVYRTDGSKTSLDYGVLVDGEHIWLPTDLTINGDVHVNGELNNRAVINGDVSATNGLSDPLGRIDGSASGNAEQVSVPEIRYNDYLEYTIGSGDYEAVEFTKRNFVSNDPLANGGAVTPDNPGGVVYLKPSSGNTVYLRNNLNFTGTLVIDGHVQLEGRNITLTAVDGFPAIVATGAIKVTNLSKNVTINGAVAARYGMLPWGSSRRSSTTINGAIISDLFGYHGALRGQHVLNYREDLADIYDFSAEPGSITPKVDVLTWDD